MPIIILIFYNGVTIDKKMRKSVVAGDFSNKLIKLCVLYVERGTSIAKAKARMTPEGARQADNLMKEFKIATLSNAKSEVTLARVAATYPEVVAKILLRKKTSKFQFCETFPVQMTFPAYISLVPFSFTKIAQCHFLWTLQFNMLINTKKPETLGNVEAVFNFWLTAWESRWINTQQRNNAMRQVGVEQSAISDILTRPVDTWTKNKLALIASRAGAEISLMQEQGVEVQEEMQEQCVEMVQGVEVQEIVEMQEQGVEVQLKLQLAQMEQKMKKVEDCWKESIKRNSQLQKSLDEKTSQVIAM